MSTARDRVIAAARRHPTPTPELASALRELDGEERARAFYCAAPACMNEATHSGYGVPAFCWLHAGDAPLVERKP